MKGCRWQFVLAQVLSMVCAAMLLINPIISQNIIDQVIVGITDPATKQTTHHVEFLVPLVVLLIGASLLRDIFYYLMLMFAENHPSGRCTVSATGCIKICSGRI